MSRSRAAINIMKSDILKIFVTILILIEITSIGANLFRKDCSEVLEDNDKLAGSVNSLNETIIKLRNEIAVIELQIGVKLDLINEQNMEILSMRKQLNNRVKKNNQSVLLNQNMKDIKLLQSQIVVANEQINHTKGVINAKNKKIEDQNVLLQTEADKVSRLEKVITNLQSQLEIATTQIKIKDDDLITSTQNINDLQGELDTAKSEIKIREDLLNLKNKEIMENNERVKVEVSRLEEMITNLQSQLEIATSQIKIKDDELITSTQNITDLQGELDRAKSEIAIREDILILKNKEIMENNERGNSLTTNIEELQNEISNIGKEKNYKDEEISKLNELLKDKDYKESLMTKTIEDLRRNLHNASGEIEISKDKIVSQNSEIERLKTLTEALESNDNEIRDQSSFDLGNIHNKGLLACIYEMKLPRIYTFKDLCKASGWTTIQRRMDGSENFDRPWKDYKDGFGNIDGEFFIGLDKIHSMTQGRRHELSITLGDATTGRIGYAHYDDFLIGSEYELYELISLGNYTGSVGDVLRSDEKQKFTTYDWQHDNYKINCAFNGNGGWWYNDCGYCTLNGNYFKDGIVTDASKNGIHWTSWDGNKKVSLTYVEIMIRPV